MIAIMVISSILRVSYFSKAIDGTNAQYGAVTGTDSSLLSAPCEIDEAQVARAHI